MKNIAKAFILLILLFGCRIQKYNYNSQDRYLTLMKGVMVNLYQIDKSNGYNVQDRINGIGHNPNAYTMLSLKQMNVIEFCVKDIIDNKIQGDLIECGVWRGGATIYMQALLKTYNDTTRRVYVADSFEGCPKPDVNKYPEDVNSNWYTNSNIAVSLEQVQANFKKFDLLNNNVIFLKGWFKNTLSTAPIKKLALLRVDGDLYESTMDALVLYDKLSIGGYFICDDYGSIPQAKKAVDDFRKKNNITEKIVKDDFTGIHWRKEK
jgi:uncharacterized protein (UPF0297 family)